MHDVQMKSIQHRSQTLRQGGDLANSATSMAFGCPQGLEDKASERERSLHFEGSMECLRSVLSYTAAHLYHHLVLVMKIIIILGHAEPITPTRCCLSRFMMVLLANERPQLERKIVNLHEGGPSQAVM
jgi:hypothetical protein